MRNSGKVGSWTFSLGCVFCALSFCWCHFLFSKLPACVWLFHGSALVSIFVFISTSHENLCWWLDRTSLVKWIFWKFRHISSNEIESNSMFDDSCSIDIQGWVWRVFESIIQLPKLSTTEVFGSKRELQAHKDTKSKYKHKKSFKVIQEKLQCYNLRIFGICWNFP